MSGLVQTILTDKEVARLLQWARVTGDLITPDELDRSLVAKLEGYSGAVACRTDGVNCPVPNDGT